MALVMVSGPGCPENDVPPSEEDALTIEAVNAVVDLDLTYPEDPVAVVLDATVRYEPADDSIFGGDYPVELSLLRLVAVDGDAAVVLGTGQMKPVGGDAGVGAGQSTTLYFYPDTTAKTSELAALCDAAAVEVEITITMPSCDCDDAVLTAPATLSCAEDRRAIAQLALTSAGPPAGMPCKRQSSASSFEDRYGYDADGRLIYRDIYDGSGHQSRLVYYWDGDRPTVVETVDAVSGELSTMLTYTWDDGGRLVRVEQRSSSPPYGTSASLYDYEDGDDLGWIRQREDGTESQRARWDELTDQLVVRDTPPTANPADTSATEVRATFSGDYVREAWLAYPEPLALASGQPVLFSAAQLDGTALWERVLVWSGDDEITSDTTTLISGAQTGTITTTWDYCR